MRRLLGLGLLALAASTGCDRSPTGSDPIADLVLYNATVITMAEGGGEAEGVAITDGKVVRVGSDDDVLALADSHTQRVDLEGRTVLPGLVDPHTHMFNDAWRLETDFTGGQDTLLKYGVTTVGDAFVTEDFVADMRDFDDAGTLRVRTSLYLIYTDNCGNLQGDWWKAYPPTREFGERLRIGGIKFFLDGGTCGRPSFREEFVEGSGFGVDPFLTVDQVAAAITAAEETGHQAIIHAMGDRAVETAQDGIARALDGRPNTLRHRIDHNVLTGPDLVRGYREIGIQPVVFAPPLVFREMITEPGACVPSLHNAYYETYTSNTRMLLDSLPDQHPAWHGDDPWVGSMRPFRDLFMMVTRIARSDDGSYECQPLDWQLATAITPAEGLRMMTLDAARALFRETEVGSLEPGKLADLIVVPGNPLTIPVDSLWNLPVDVTVMDGEIVRCRVGCW